MIQFDITGMSCAACCARVEKAVSDVEGVISCSVNLLTNSMSVEASASNDEIIKAVEAAGYGATLKGASKKEDDKFIQVASLLAIAVFSKDLLAFINKLLE